MSNIEKMVAQASAKKMTMEKTLCLGCCDCAPAVVIDGEVAQGPEAKTKVEKLLA